MKPQPLIVPLVMANFDKLASENIYKCEIKAPFRMGDLGVNDKKDITLPQVVDNLNQQYKKWVSILHAEDQSFESEIKQLENRVLQKKIKDDLVVFYGSSTIRLWESVKEDFQHSNTLNLGFGGAFISSLSQHFERLFTFEAPKVIVLFIGGNDLTLGWTAIRIVQKIKTLIEKINRKYPSSTILNLSIKPSLERAGEIKKIKEINKAMQVWAETKTFLKQIDFFDDLMEGGKVNQDYFLQDGLHLNAKGYNVLKKKLKPYL